jgi:hypothetical protein
MIRYLIALPVLALVLSAAPVPVTAANQVVAQWTTEDDYLGGPVKHNLWIADGNLKYNEVDPSDGSRLKLTTMMASRAKCLTANQARRNGDFTIDVVTKGLDVVDTIGKEGPMRTGRMFVDFTSLTSGDSGPTVLTRLRTVLHVGNC